MKHAPVLLVCVVSLAAQVGYLAYAAGWHAVGVYALIDCASRVMLKLAQPPKS